MAAKGLGRGLDSLIPNNMDGIKNNKTRREEVVVDEKNAVIMVKITKVEPNREQPRKTFKEESLNELADSIKQYGVIQPITVVKRPDYYEIVAGERRWRASKIAGMKEIPVIVKELSQREIDRIRLIENLQREGLNSIEEALGFKKSIDDYSLTQEELAKELSKSRTYITNSLRLLKLSEEVQQMIIDEKISTGHARSLIGIEDKNQQIELANKIYNEKLTVRDIEKLVKDLSNPKQKKKDKKKDESLETIYRSIEERLKQSLGTKVAISSKDNGSGKLEIDFFSHEELERITDFFMKKGE